MSKPRIAVSLLLLMPWAAPAQQPDPTGLWAGEIRTPPRLAGALTLSHQGSRWIARIGNLEASGAARGDSLVISFSDSAGVLKAYGVAAGSPRAYWVQPAGDAPAYATPIRLVVAGADRWRGEVVPLEQRFTLFLRLYRDSTGVLRGRFHNPEFNWNGRGAPFRVEVRADALTFLDTSGERRLVQPWNPDSGVIHFDFAAPLELRRIEPQHAAGYVPRITDAPYRYRPPADLDDGWAVGNATSTGFDEDSLATVVRTIIGSDPASDTTIRLHSLLVARHGRLVLDEYFRDFTAERTHDLRSASKTFTSLMFGVAMREHPGLNTATSARGFFPGSTLDRRITIGQLLSHSSGLACDDNGDDSPGSEDKMQETADWYAFTLALPRIHPPGTVYAYCSGGINLVGGIIARASDAWLPDYFDRQLAVPLQIDHYAMNLMPDGQGYSGGGVYLRPRDLLKFGEMMLRDGGWHGRQVVPADWVRQSTALQMAAPDGSSDGFGWHRHLLHAGGRDYQSFEANGNGGQFLIVVPDLDLAIVTTAGNYGQYFVWRKIRQELVPRVMNAVRREE